MELPWEEDKSNCKAKNAKFIHAFFIAVELKGVIEFNGIMNHKIQSKENKVKAIYSPRRTR